MINNNIVSAFDEIGREVVVMGCGIGFGSRPGAKIPEDKIEKIFRIESGSVADQFKELLAGVPLEHAKISSDIISYAKGALKLKLNQSIYVTLTDHINFAIARYAKGSTLKMHCCGRSRGFILRSMNSENMRLPRSKSV